MRTRHRVPTGKGTRIVLPVPGIWDPAILADEVIPSCSSTSQDRVSSQCKLRVLIKAHSAKATGFYGTYSDKIGFFKSLERMNDDRSDGYGLPHNCVG